MWQDSSDAGPDGAGEAVPQHHEAEVAGPLRLGIREQAWQDSSGEM